MLPILSGKPIRVEIRKELGAHLAAASIPDRRILLAAELLATPGEFDRILIHELFHFAWVRLGNPLRASWGQVLESERRRGARGELGWSSEWRKAKLAAGLNSQPAWRRYICESFCDTAAWRFSGLSRHDEFTLGTSERNRRGRWFEQNIQRRLVAI